jgi:hypothetical protein
VYRNVRWLCKKNQEPVIVLLYVIIRTDGDMFTKINREITAVSTRNLHRTVVYFSVLLISALFVSSVIF